MSIQPSELWKKLTPDVREAILRDNWHSHDARWFLKTGLECGFDLANRLNKTTLKSMAKTEMRRILQAIDNDVIETIEDLVEVIKIALEFYFPRPLLESEIKTVTENSVVGIVNRCLVFEEVKKAGVVAEYECACGCRFEGWLESCGFNSEVNIVKSLMRGDSFCEISLSSISRMSRFE